MDMLTAQLLIALLFIGLPIPVLFSPPPTYKTGHIMQLLFGVLILVITLVHLTIVR